MRVVKAAEHRDSGLALTTALMGAVLPRPTLRRSRLRGYFRRHRRRRARGVRSAAEGGKGWCAGGFPRRAPLRKMSVLCPAGRKQPQPGQGPRLAAQNVTFCVTALGGSRDFVRGRSVGAQSLS